MIQKFKIGQVVVLKSGGPKMTIEADELGSAETGVSRAGLSPEPEFEPVFNGKYRCTWFVGSSKHSAEFPQETLEWHEGDPF